MMRGAVVGVRVAVLVGVAAAAGCNAATCELCSCERDANGPADVVCACGLCIAAAYAPSDLAVQVTVRDGRILEGTCVEL